MFQFSFWELTRKGITNRSSGRAKSRPPLNSNVRKHYEKGWDCVMVKHDDALEQVIRFMVKNSIGGIFTGTPRDKMEEIGVAVVRYIPI